MSKIKHEDLKCEFCNGLGEREKNIDGMDCPVTCTLCNGTGIDTDQLNRAFQLIIYTPYIRVKK